MPPPSTGVTDATLLCERCGYVLEGLDERGACPECGQKIAESLPSRRTGTPFQSVPAPRAFLVQSLLLIRRPRHVFGQLRVGSPSDLLFAGVSMGLSAVLLLVPAGLGIMSELGEAAEAFPFLWVLLLLWVGTLAALALFTYIEQIGVVFFSSKRGWRVPAPLATAIVCNAAPGWLAAGMLMNVGVILMSPVESAMYDLPRNYLPWLRAAAVALPFLGFVAGMLIFETLVYIGVRRCKYANWNERPQQQPEPHPGESPAPH